ncbi:hypothetical protein NQ318_022981 [Aromia moschata]|uniref:Uncharacterized protein n=1 Tax=Aromia moschata TaxID=1265417 RepID=A0AAV8YBP1_9CUCU|nr:hypothetical protein NQ318_022981 [Aromia moschata]
MQNLNEDTEWNDILREKGIIPQKEKEITEDQIVSMLEETIEKKTTTTPKLKPNAVPSRFSWSHESEERKELKENVQRELFNVNRNVKLQHFVQIH